MLVPETVKSIPVCRIAVPQVSPSIPTHTEAEWVSKPSEGVRGVGTTKVPFTDLKVFCRRYDMGVSAYLLP